MRIAIFEDDPTFADWLETMTGGDCDMLTADPDKLALYAKSLSAPALFLLDIVGEQNRSVGFALADRIAAANEDHLIVFLTAYPERIAANTPYKVKAFNTILKDSPLLEQEIAHTIRLAGEVLQSRCLLVHFGRWENHYLPHRSILLLEHVKGSNRVSIRHTAGEAVVGGTLAAFQQQLDDRFVRCHNAFLVNRQHIRSIDKQARLVHLSDGSTCPYAFARRKELGL